MARAFVPHTITSDSALGGSVIDHSIRFNRGDNPHFSRTPSSAGNRKVWTYSVWLKRTDFGQRSFFQAYDGSSSRRFQLSFNNDDTLNFNQGGNSSSGLAGSYMMFRDPTAWYHIVAVADYKNSTAADRFKVYVNGSQISLNITDSIEDADGQCNGAFEHEIGAVGSSNSVFDGYMADINFIDGQALDASYFGYTEFQTKVWRPKRYTGTYGNNGFKLDFRDFSGDTATTIGRDYSGNQNNFSPDNFGGTGDGAIDSPTNNFTSFNKIMDYSLNADITEAGLRVEGPDSGHNDRRIYAPFAIPLTGKYYVEVKCVKNGARGTIGFSDGDINGGGSGNNWFSFGFHGGGYSTSFTKVGSNTSDFSLNDYVSFALDMDAGKMWLVKNGNVDVTAQESITNIIRTNLDRPLRWFYQETSSDESAALFNFGQFPYNYTVPDGFKTLSSRNIQPTYFDATNQPAKTFLNPKKHFDVLTYSGNSSSSKVVTGLEFEPDFVWIKAYSGSSSPGSQNNYLVDSVRGATGSVTKKIYSNSDAVENGGQNDSANGVKLISNGIELTTSNDGTNSNNNYVAWCWKAGDSTSSNTAGDVTSTVSVNDEAGFSIVSFTTPSSGSGFSIGHGLSKAPETIWMKNRSYANNWDVYHHDNGSSSMGPAEQYRLVFNSTAAREDQPFLDDTVPTSSVFRTRGNNQWYPGNNQIIAYCFYSVPGFSKYGSYVGNGSSNGVYVHLGFKPAMMIIKRISNTEDWWIHDYKRNPYNPVNNNLYPNGTNSTATEVALDHYADGFKLRTSNQNWNNNNEIYVYWAWADQPGITTYGSSPTAR